MTHEDYLGWLEYFTRQPYGWREDLRAYYAATAMAGKDAPKPEQMFPSIAQLKKAETQSKIDNSDDESNLQKSLQRSAFGTMFQQHLDKANDTKNKV